MADPPSELRENRLLPADFHGRIDRRFLVEVETDGGRIETDLATRHDEGGGGLQQGVLIVHQSSGGRFPVESGDVDAGDIDGSEHLARVHPAIDAEEEGHEQDCAPEGGGDDHRDTAS